MLNSRQSYVFLKVHIEYRVFSPLPNSPRSIPGLVSSNYKVNDVGSCIINKAIETKVSNMINFMGLVILVLINAFRKIYDN